MDDIVKRKKKRSGFLPIIVGIIIGTVVGVLISVFDILPEEPLFPGANIGLLIAFPFIVAAAGALSGVLIHELGHLVFGLLTGYKFLSFRLYSMIWFKEGGRIRFKLSKSFLLGQCLMEPVKDYKQSGFVLYNLGGVIGNLFLAGVMWVLIFIVNSLMAQFIIGGVLFLNFVFAITNAIPTTSAEAPTDGANIREGLKSKEALRAFHLQLAVNHEVAAGKRYRELDIDSIKPKEGADLSNYLIAYLVALEAEYWGDSGDPQKALETLGKLDAEELPAVYRQNILVSRLQYSMFTDINAARELYERDDVKAALKKSVPEMQIIKAVYEMVVLGNVDDSRARLSKIRKKANDLPSKGERIMMDEYINQLEITFEKFFVKNIKKPIDKS